MTGSLTFDLASVISPIEGQEHDRVSGQESRARNAVRFQAALEQLDNYGSIIEVMSEGIAVLLADGMILTANESAIRLVGGTYDQLVGKRLTDIRWHAIDEEGETIPHNDHPALITLRTGQPLTNVIMGLYRPDRSIVWLSVNTRPLIRPRESDPYAVVASFTDMTAWKDAERDLHESESRFRRLSDASMDGVAITIRGVIREVNLAMCRIFGYEEEEFVGMPAINLSAPETRTSVAVRVGQALEGTYTTLGLHKDGTTRIPMRVIAHTMYYNGQPARVTVVRDLREYEVLERMQREFVSTISHELRTPLTSIRGALGLICGGAAGEVAERADSLARLALSNAERLTRLINDILDLEKIESGMLDLSMTSVTASDIVNTAIAGIAPIAAQRKIRIDSQMGFDLPFFADRDRLIQALANLLSNAVKFSYDDSTVTLRVSSADQSVRFEVVDRGSGIAPGLLNRLFKKFSQVDSSDKRRKGGAGLGLVIARSIVHQHGGRMGVDSEPDVETTFWFTIPIAESHASEYL